MTTTPRSTPSDFADLDLSTVGETLDAALLARFGPQLSSHVSSRAVLANGVVYVYLTPDEALAVALLVADAAYQARRTVAPSVHEGLDLTQYEELRADEARERMYEEAAERADREGYDDRGDHQQEAMDR